jgi:hypothetical protein
MDRVSKRQTEQLAGSEQATERAIQLSKPERGKRYFSSPEHPDRLQYPKAFYSVVVSPG